MKSVPGRSTLASEASIGLYRKIAIVIQDEVDDSNGGNA